MKNAKDFFANAAAIIYFITIMLGTIFLLLLAPIMLLVDISRIMESGFANTNTGMDSIWILGMFIGISLLVPPFRRMYYKLPWLFPLVKIFYVNVVITGIAVTIMNYGYEIQDEARHTMFFTLAIAVLVVGRFLMCLWFNKRKVEYIGRQVNV